MKALIWKELREYRMFLIAAVLILILFKIVHVIFWKIYLVHPDYEMYFSVTGWVLLPLLFSFIGSMTFTSEFQQNTKAFLLTKPFNTSKIFIGKFFAGLILTMILNIISILLVGDLADSVKHVTPEAIGLAMIYSVLLSALSYNLIILASLIVRQTLPSIFLAPLLLIPEIVIICPFMVCIYYYCRFEVMLPLIALIFIVFNAVLSYLAWQRAVVKDIKPWRQLVKAGAIVFVLAWSFHLFISIQSQFQLSSAKAKAEKAGFDFKIIDKMCEKVPDEQNSVVIYREASKKLDAIGSKFIIKKAEVAGENNDWTDICNYTNKYRINNLTDEQRAKIRKVLIDDEDIVNFWALIKKGAGLKYTSVGVKTEEERTEAFFDALNNLRNILPLVASRASALAEEGRVDESIEAANIGFKIIQTYARLMAYFVPMHSDISFAQYDNIKMSMLAVPKNPGMLTYLRKIMNQGKDLNRIKLTEQIIADSVPMVYIHYYENMMADKCSRNDSYYAGFDSKSARLYTNFIVSPYLKNDAASFLSKSIMIRENLKDNKPLTRIQGFPRLSLDGKIFMNNYFLYALDTYLYEVDYSNASQTVDSDWDKITIALKIFKIQYGKYPEKLEQLVPEIIPELPVELCAKGKLKYRTIDNGFSMYTTMLKNYHYGDKEIYMDR